MNERLRTLLTYPTVALQQRVQALQQRGRRVFDFGTGDAVEPTPAAIRAAFAAGLQPTSRYGGVDGSRALRQAVAGYVERRFAVHLDADREVLPTLGSREALFHLPQLLVQIPSDKDLVVYGEPGWPVFELGALFAEAWTYAAPLLAEHRFLLDPDLLPEATLRRAAIVFLSYPHDPSGQCLPDGLFAAWVEARERYGFLLVSDECYADLWYEEPRPRSLLEFGRKGCLVAHSLSQRSGMAGYRSGFLAGDAEVLAHYRRFRAGMGLAQVDAVEAAATVAWSDDAHVAERRAAFAQKRQVLRDGLQRLGLRVYPGTAGMSLWVDTPAGTTDLAYADRLAEAGIVVAPGSHFGRSLTGSVRVLLSPSLADCEAALAAWPR